MKSTRSEVTEKKEKDIDPGDTIQNVEGGKGSKIEQGRLARGKSTGDGCGVHRIKKNARHTIGRKKRKSDPRQRRSEKGETETGPRFVRDLEERKEASKWPNYGSPIENHRTPHPEKNVTEQGRSAARYA